MTDLDSRRRELDREHRDWMREVFRLAAQYFDPREDRFAPSAAIWLRIRGDTIRLHTNVGG